MTHKTEDIEDFLRRVFPPSKRWKEDFFDGKYQEYISYIHNQLF